MPKKSQVSFPFPLPLWVSMSGMNSGLNNAMARLHAIMWVSGDSMCSYVQNGVNS